MAIHIQKSHEGLLHKNLGVSKKKKNFPKGFSVMCPTCHAAKHFYGKCSKSY